VVDPSALDSVIFVKLPRPEAANEAYVIAAVPVAAPELRFRAFALEKAVLPTGDTISFVVEWAGPARFNYGVPEALSLEGLLGAVAEIADGTRQPITTMAAEVGGAGR
jgi:hypothetical protein